MPDDMRVQNPHKILKGASPPPFLQTNMIEIPYLIKHIISIIHHSSRGVLQVHSYRRQNVGTSSHYLVYLKQNISITHCLNLQVSHLDYIQSEKSIKVLLLFFDRMLVCHGKRLRVKSYKPKGLMAVRAYPSLRSIKQIRVVLFLMDGMLVHCRLPTNILSGLPDSSPVPVYTPGWREAL